MKRSLVLLAIAALAAGCGGSKNAPSTTKTSSTTEGATGGTLITRANAAPAGSPDPQVNYTQQLWAFLINTHDGLVGFKRVGGAEGTKLVPDLAATIPKPTDGGRTWTFTIRRGIRFSNGKALAPADVKATFERLFKIGDSPNAGSWYSVIVGASECVKQPTTCDLSRGVVIKGNTVTFHLTRGDPEFLQKLAMPFAFILPAETPTKHLDMPPPGTGPYMWVEYAPRTAMRVVRNKFFRLWSADAQPEGLPDVIEQRFGLTVDAEVTQVENGQADWIADSDPIPPDRLSEIGKKYPSQVHINPLPATWYFAMNTRIAPFDNLKARQAVNTAVDRTALVSLLGGPKLATPTCQVLPPNFPGYKPYCPYTANPASGKWTGPDMPKARQLIEESGTKGMHVKVNSDTTDVDKGLGLYFIGLLNDLGYKASAQFLSSDIQYPYSQNSKNKVQFAYSRWLADYPAASDFLQVLLSCGSFHPNSNSSPNISQFCDNRIEAKMNQAATTAITEPQAANELWAQVDHEVTDAAPWVALFNPASLDFTSKRIKGFQFNPQWYFLLDQASVK
ncbi:MAG: ABC transporter substrate-binding protein [Solirubrobacteraceae bacterium]